MTRSTLSPRQARRIALAAQGFADPAPRGPVNRGHLRRMVDRIRLVQMDSVNIVARAHYLPLFSRVGAYDPDVVWRSAWGPRRADRFLVEYWAHEAALVPLTDWPLFGWRRIEYKGGRYRHTREVLRRNPRLTADVRAVIADRGASTPRQIEDALGIEREPGIAGSWWERGEVKNLCEALFAGGDLSGVRDRTFTRYYDLTERVVGADLAAATVEPADAVRTLVAGAARALGVATVADLADYYRLKTAATAPAVRDLVDAGTLTPVAVDGWRDDAYLHTGAVLPRHASRSAILSPFDPLVFYRPRAERLFDFHYRIEIYVPEHKRVHGYYVLPYLLGEDIVARVDLKADRQAGVLRVLAAHLEPGHDGPDVADRLAGDLAAMAQWLELSAIEVAKRGDLAPTLRSAVAAASVAEA